MKNLINKTKTILGIFIFSVLVAMGASGDAMAGGTVIDKLEFSYPAAVGGTVLGETEVTAYVNGVAQSSKANVYSLELADAYDEVIPTGATFEKKGYYLTMIVDAPDGYVFTCDSYNFNGSVLANGQSITNFEYCNSSRIKFRVDFDFRDYYDVTKLNFGIEYPTATSVAGDIDVTQLSSLDGLYAGDGGWFRYNENCDFGENFDETFACWEENSALMDDDETFNYGEQYTYVFMIDHPNYVFYDIDITQLLTSLPKTAKVNNTSTRMMLMSGSVVNMYYVFYNIPELKDHLTVTFDTQGIGVAPEAQDITPNTVAMEPTVTADGYVFDGWYYDEDCTLPVDFDAIISTDVTFYAKWISVVGVPDTGTETENLSVTVTGLSVGVLVGAVIAGVVASMVACRRKK